MVRVAADGRKRRVQADIVKVVEARRKTALREHRDAGDEYESDVAFGTFQEAVYFSKAIPVRASLLAILQHVQNRLVVLVH